MNVPTAVAMFVSDFHLKLTPEVRWPAAQIWHVITPCGLTLLWQFSILV